MKARVLFALAGAPMLLATLAACGSTPSSSATARQLADQAVAAASRFASTLSSASSSCSAGPSGSRPSGAMPTWPESTSRRWGPRSSIW